MRRTLGWALALLVLSGCTAEPERTANQSPGSTSTSSEASAAALGDADRSVCETFVSGQGDVFELVDTIKREGSVAQSESVKAGLDLVSIDSIAESYSGQLSSDALEQAVADVGREGAVVSDAITAGQGVNPDPLWNALRRAAKICSDGGVSIPWYGQ